MSALTLSTYNMVQISKLETAIEAQKQKTDLLADIVKLHKQHLHQLDKTIVEIGNKLQKLKVQAGFPFSIDRAIAQVISDTNKLQAVIAIFKWVIHLAFDLKLAPGALSINVFETIVKHVKDPYGCHQPISQLQQSTFRSLQTGNIFPSLQGGKHSNPHSSCTVCCSQKSSSPLRIHFSANLLQLFLQRFRHSGHWQI